jgi:hypothetical protein
MTYLAWMALPGPYAPASIALSVIGARKLPLCDNALAFEEVIHALRVTLTGAEFKFYNNLNNAVGL